MAGIGALKGVKMAICGIKCIDVTNKAIKISDLFFYDENLQFKNNFRKTILSIDRILKMWRLMNLTLEGNIYIYFQNISFIKLLLVIPNQIIDTLQQIRKDFLWK